MNVTNSHGGNLARENETSRSAIGTSGATFNVIHVPRSCCTDQTAGGFGFGVGIAVGFGVAVGGGIGLTVGCGVAVGNIGDGVGVAAGSGAAAWLAVPAGIDVLAGVVSPSSWVQAAAANREAAATISVAVDLPWNFEELPPGQL